MTKKIKDWFYEIIFCHSNAELLHTIQRDMEEAWIAGYEEASHEYEQFRQESDAEETKLNGPINGNSTSN